MCALYIKNIIVVALLSSLGAGKLCANFAIKDVAILGGFLTGFCYAAPTIVEHTERVTQQYKQRQVLDNLAYELIYLRSVSSEKEFRVINIQPLIDCSLKKNRPEVYTHQELEEGNVFVLYGLKENLIDAVMVLNKCVTQPCSLMEKNALCSEALEQLNKLRSKLGYPAVWGMRDVSYWFALKKWMQAHPNVKNIAEMVAILGPALLVSGYILDKYHALSPFFSSLKRMLVGSPVIPVTNPNL